ncbi:mitochondrial ribonuclease P catalytic subunit-like isoform X1 [Oncorhynchus nerka]|uniref:mitochondrial ribonuclease P catalytic subunit-like isoform X1 n=2 Tax=Oncorhynchus nerka TaxID=8023 RepID=UPI0031B7F6BF
MRLSDHRHAFFCRHETSHLTVYRCSILLLTMSSLLILKTRICLKYISPLFNPSTAGFTPLNNVISKLSVSSRLLCTKGGSRHAGNNRKEDRQREFNIRERLPFPKSVFASGTAKRTAEYQKKRAEEEPDFPRKNKRVKPPDHPLTASEWKSLKLTSPNPDRFDVRMMSSMLADGTDINVAKSLLAYVAMDTGTLSYELLLRYLTLCVGSGHHSEVFDMYDIMRSRFRTLDTGASSLFIKGFSRTERWKEALTILENIKRAITPSPRNYGDTIAGAVLHGDGDTAWALYAELMEKGLIPNQETWQALFQCGLSHQGHEDGLQSILLHMRDNQIYPEETLAKDIKAWFESHPEQKWIGSWSTVDPRGVCRSCQAELESIQLSREEYAQLKDRVMGDVIQGRDVFNKTTPEELESFKNFVKRKPAFDVVIDGLNVANIGIKGNQSQTLLEVVSELERQGLVILVLGRKHMQRPSRSWDRHDMSLVQQKAHCFFTDNISEDDPFLLYATLHSGNHCNFVSRDLMRDHKACLPDGATRRLFFKWQRGHQLVLSSYTPGKRVRFQRILSYDTIVQTNGGSWHIPYDENGAERCTYEVPQKWLCLTKAK